jgi:serine/threonine protein kinase
MPKIADFGLSRLFSDTLTRHTTKKYIGTVGYMPPEYIQICHITEKFDVFSLGVIIIEIMTGTKETSKRADMSPQQFIELVSNFLSSFIHNFLHTITLCLNFSGP